ncbi:5-formyltetrahydrofolate cyclo-ligase [Utexia brackfieldae]|uniref:5-formyltetrahydrofolate cyclo-ligase n=1 Tax=Utexia brackfieldae TaxID=3074108 RepID=UPI00370D0BBF
MNLSNSHHLFSLQTTLRQQMRRFRKSLSEQAQQMAGQALKEHVLKLSSVTQAKHIALFLSFDGEINTAPLITALWQQQKSIYLPLIHPFTPHQLLFIAYRPDTPLIAGPFGILRPQLDIRHLVAASQLDIIFTPLVVFDKRGYRIGMGGGYYDRLLADYHKQSFLPIGLAHDCQQIESVPNHPWDIQLPQIVTDKQHIIINHQNSSRR